MATTTQTQISNIFNLMVQQEPRILFYHFGWRSDILRNIDNNFDNNNIKGRQFPALHFAVPESTKYLEAINYDGIKEEVEVTLYFDNLQDCENDGSAETDNLIEQWAELKQIAEDYIANFSEVLCNKYLAGSITAPKFEQFSHGHNDRLITWRVTFNLIHTIPCTDPLNKIDLSLLPSSLTEIDLENWKSTGPPPDACSILLASISAELMCNCVIPSLDFSVGNDTDFDCLTQQQIDDLTIRLGSGSLIVPKMAFSTRLIVPGYTGDCMTIRRGSDDATLAIGFLAGVLDTAAIIAFCGASIGYVKCWHDQSPNLANAEQLTLNFQPQIYDGANIHAVNGFPSIRFINAQTFTAKALDLRYQVSVDLNDDVMFYVAKEVSQLVQNASLFVGGSDAAANIAGFGTWLTAMNADQFSWSSSSPIIGRTIESGKSTIFDFKLSSFNLNTIRRNGVDVGTYLEQVAQSTAFLVDTIGTANPNRNLISANIYMTELLLQSNACTDDPAANQAAIESEIVTYYSL
jgi:hypothetical protein